MEPRRKEKDKPSRVKQEFYFDNPLANSLPLQISGDSILARDFDFSQNLDLAPMISETVATVAQAQAQAQVPVPAPVPKIEPEITVKEEVVDSGPRTRKPSLRQREAEVSAALLKQTIDLMDEDEADTNELMDESEEDYQLSDQEEVDEEIPPLEADELQNLGQATGVPTKAILSALEQQKPKVKVKQEPASAPLNPSIPARRPPVEMKQNPAMRGFFIRDPETIRKIQHESLRVEAEGFLTNGLAGRMDLGMFSVDLTPSLEVHALYKTYITDLKRRIDEKATPSASSSSIYKPV